MTRRLLLIGGLFALLAGCGTTTPYEAPPPGDPAMCELHHQPMQWSKVKIHYGLPSREHWKEAGRFPHSAGNGPRRGFIVLEQKYAWSWVCDQCTKAQEEWNIEWRNRSK